LRPLSHAVVGRFLLSVVRILRALRLGRLVGNGIIALGLIRFARRLAVAGGLVGMRLFCFTLFRLYVVSLLRRVHYWPCSARLREDHAIEQVVGGKRQAVDWAQAL
jgi:hypothetical protein